MSTSAEPQERAQQLEGVPVEVASFIHSLTSLTEHGERGELAKLRRSAGHTLSQAGATMGLFYRLLPSRAYRQEEIFFLVATLYPLNPRQLKGDFGTTMAALRSAASLSTLDRRMAILLDSDFDQIDDKVGGGSLSYRLRQLVKYAASKQVGVDWARLLADLLYWTNSEKRVQKRWARSYYQGTRPQENKGGDK